MCSSPALAIQRRPRRRRWEYTGRLVDTKGVDEVGKVKLDVFGVARVSKVSRSGESFLQRPKK